jgi:hypothetical protein
MAGRIRIAALTALALVWAGFSSLEAQSPSNLPKPLESPDGAFVVYSPDRGTRSELASMAAEALLIWKKTIGPDGGPPTPIIIQDKSRSPASHRTQPLLCSLFEIENGGLKVQVDLLDPAARRAHTFQTGVLRALALEAMHRADPPKAGKSYAQPPDWLVEGLGEELRRRNGHVPDGIHAALLRGHQPPSLKEFLLENPDRLDATSLLLYRARALALVRVLSKGGASSKRLAEFLENSKDRPSTAESLTKAFPEAGPDASTLSKLWTLSLARSSLPPRLASLSVSKTDKELAAILAVSNSSAENPDTSPLLSSARDKGGPFLMRQRAAELLQLEFRAHPLLRPVVEEYRNIVSLLALKPKARLERRIEDNEKIRSLLVERHMAVSDYLNWFEATQIDESETPLSEQTRPLELPPRNDPVTLYLDAIEKRGW